MGRRGTCASRPTKTAGADGTSTRVAPLNLLPHAYGDDSATTWLPFARCRGVLRSGDARGLSVDSWHPGSAERRSRAGRGMRHERALRQAPTPHRAEHPRLRGWAAPFRRRIALVLRQLEGTPRERVIARGARIARYLCCGTFFERE